MGRYIWNVTIKYLTRVEFEKQLTALHVFHTFYLFLTDMCSLCWQTCGPGPKLFPRLDIYRGAKSAQTLYNTLKTHTKYAHIVRGRPTLKDVARFPRPRTSSRCYHGNKSAATFKKGIFVHPPWVPNCMQNLKGGWKFSFPKMFDSYKDLFLSLSSSILWLTVSKAFFRSVKTPHEK